MTDAETEGKIGTSNAAARALVDSITPGSRPIDEPPLPSAQPPSQSAAMMPPRVAEELRQIALIIAWAVFVFSGVTLGHKLIDLRHMNDVQGDCVPALHIIDERTADTELSVRRIGLELEELHQATSRILDDVTRLDRTYRRASNGRPPSGRTGSRRN